MSSYQQNNPPGYHTVSVVHDDDSNVIVQGGGTSEFSRFLRNRRFLKVSLAALAVVAVGWITVSSHASSSSSSSSPSSAAKELSMSLVQSEATMENDTTPKDNDNKETNMNDTCQVVVDDRGVILDGPGSDGSCNDPPTWYHDQLIDHFAKNKEDPSNKWSQKCFVNTDYFRGPGYPIFFIMGGEGDANCLLYPFVTYNLARIFGGATIECEHRFYGKSQPINPLENVRDMIGILTVEQALADELRFLKVQQDALECSTDRSDPNYCPVITVGASYPGFLAAMMRFVHPDVVDIAYASSAPLPLYAQDVDPDAYFDRITVAADHESSGCAAAVKATLLEVQAELLLNSDNKDDYLTAAERLGICANAETTAPLPAYIQSKQMLWHELEYAVAAQFADFNMGNYPPNPLSTMNQACQVFQNTGWDAYEKMQNFWQLIIEDAGDGWEYSTECFDFASQIPDGPNSTVYCADWTGGGNGKTGLSWDFQQCTELIVQTGYGPKSMFPRREWTLEALTEHCQSRFGVTPTPHHLVDKWHFDDLVGQGASRFIFTNGLNDGWSADSILDNLSPDIVAINMPNGAHRSDLDHHGPRSVDTEDIKASRPLVLQALTRWLTEIKQEMHGGECP